MSDIEDARVKRNHIKLAADYISSNGKALAEFGTALEWNELKKIPIWVFFSQDRINHMVMTAGTIFLLPSIRIWIDSKRLQEIRALIGDVVFDFIMNNTHVENNKIHSLHLTNVAENVKAAGSAVIISSHSLRLRPWLVATLPKPKGKLDTVLAEEIMKHTLFVLEQTGVTGVDNDSNTRSSQ